MDRRENKHRRRLVVTLSTIAAMALLLGAFIVVWLVPRGPEVGDASGGGGGAGSSQQQAGTAGISGAGGTPAYTTNYSQSGAPGMIPYRAPITDQPGISVNGTGVVSASPDMLNLQVGVQTQRDSLEAAQSEASDKMNAMMEQLKNAGVDEKDISTAQYSVEPVMVYRDNQPPVVTGFRVTNIVNVKLRDITRAGKLIDDLVKSGANTVYGLSFGFSDPAALMRQARERAMQDARAKAEQLASLGGVTLGTPIMITEGITSTPPPVIPMAAAGSARDTASATPIQPGQQEVRVEVQVIYSIK